MDKEIKSKLKVLAKKISQAGRLIASDTLLKDYTIGGVDTGFIIVRSDSGYEAIYIGNTDRDNTDGYMCLYTHNTPKRNSFPNQTTIEQLLLKVLLREKLEAGEGKAGYFDWAEFGGMDKQLKYFSEVIKRLAFIEPNAQLEINKRLASIKKNDKLELFWVSMIIQDTETSRPWLCAQTESCLSLEEAHEVINKGKTNRRLLSAWIDVFDNNVKTTVFHECYLDTIGAL